MSHWLNNSLKGQLIILKALKVWSERPKPSKCGYFHGSNFQSWMILNGFWLWLSKRFIINDSELFFQILWIVPKALKKSLSILTRLSLNYFCFHKLMLIDLQNGPECNGIGEGYRINNLVVNRWRIVIAGLLCRLAKSDFEKYT